MYVNICINICVFVCVCEHRRGDIYIFKKEQLCSDLLKNKCAVLNSKLTVSVRNTFRYHTFALSFPTSFLLFNLNFLVHDSYVFNAFYRLCFSQRSKRMDLLLFTITLMNIASLHTRR